jgi:cobalamin biosynthesis Mg chelatase CobN
MKMQNENTLMILGDSPIEAVATEKVKAMADRVRTLVQDGGRLSPQQALTIAQLSILTRTLPGRDVHYFLDQNGNLKMSDDYKFLRAWAVRREQFVTGDQAATFEDVYTELDDTAKVSEGISPNDFAVFCTLTTKRERDNFRREVKGWIDLGFAPDEAVAMARSVLGTIGTRAVGVVNANDGLTNSNGESKKVPKGWSLMQKARKLAFKNAVHAKWGQPSVDDLQQMVKSMARGDVIDADWEAVPADVTAEEQARYAEGNAVARKVKAETLTQDQRQERKAANTEAMRGNGDDAIGESDKERFTRRVIKEIPFYTSQSQVFMTLLQLGIEFSPETEELCFDELAKDASKQADRQAA